MGRVCFVADTNHQSARTLSATNLQTFMICVCNKVRRVADKNRESLWTFLPTESADLLSATKQTLSVHCHGVHSVSATQIGWSWTQVSQTLSKHLEMSRWFVSALCNFHDSCL